ncbi:MAG: hypothetical protein AAF845_06595 [Bacteroidota bacterium]
MPALALILLLVACGAEADPEAVADEEAESGLFDDDFASVCRGTAGQPAAAAYEPGPGLHPFVHLASDGDAEYRQSRAGEFPEGWRVEWPDFASAQLVLCVTRTEATPVQLCEGYRDDDTGAEWSIEMYSAVYAYELRAAQTAELVASRTFEADAEACPGLSFYRDDDPLPMPNYAAPTPGEVELFVQPVVAGG